MSQKTMESDERNVKKTLHGGVVFKDQLKLELHAIKMVLSLDKNGGAGKISGVGGGVCGIAVCFDDSTSQKILEEWDENNIQGSEVEIDYEGLKIEHIQ